MTSIAANTPMMVSAERKEKQPGKVATTVITSAVASATIFGVATAVTEQRSLTGVKMASALATGVLLAGGGALAGSLGDGGGALAATGGAVAGMGLLGAVVGAKSHRAGPAAVAAMLGALVFTGVPATIGAIVN